MNCINCGKELDREAKFCPDCGSAVETEKVDKIVFAPIEKKKYGVGLIILITVLVTFVIASIGAVTYMIYKTNLYEENMSEDTKKKIEYNEKKIEKDEKPDKKEKETYEIEDDFEFRFNQKNLLINPTYRWIKDQSYSFYCAVPDHFVADYNDRTFYAPDYTAMMEIRTEVNKADISVSDAMNYFVREVSGDVTYSASGDDWFALSIEKDGVLYYMKGFVDHYIREFTFTFPKEYKDVYGDYVEYIEDNFRRTDTQ